MSELQKEATAAKSMASKYIAISAVIHLMPDRFKLLDLLKAAGIKDGMQVRGAVGSVLFRDFGCVNVGTGVNRVWKKPS